MDNHGAHTDRPIRFHQVLISLCWKCPAYKSKQLNVSELARVCHISLSHSPQVHWTFGSIKRQGAEIGTLLIILQTSKFK